MKRLWPVLILACALCLGFGFGVPKPETASMQATGPDGLPAIIFVAAPKVVPGQLTGRFPEGSHLVRYTPGTPASSAVNLTPNFYAVADPQVSFSATMVLFAGQKTRRAQWQIWEMKVDGSGLRQITNCSEDCFQPAYLPHGQIAYTAVTGKGSRQSSAIYVSQLSGTDPHRITFGPGDYHLETVLRSGRLLVSAKPSLAAVGKDDGSRVFYTLRPDGSGLFLFRWGTQPNYLRTSATELWDGSVLFVKRKEQAGRLMGGELAWIQPGALHNSVITRLGSAYWSVHVLDGENLVVSRRSSEGSAGAGKFGLYVFHLGNRSAGKEIYTNPKLSSVEPVPIEPSAIPLYFPSMLHLNWNYGRIVCLNSYLSSETPNGLLAGHIAKVRVIALGAGDHNERVLGEAAVENDGSFYIKVPADKPLRFELIGAGGSVIREQKSWVWAGRGEDVACLGCHESHAIVPQDRFPQALKNSNTPIAIGLSASTTPHKH